MNPLEILTSRLRLLALTAESSAAAINNLATFSSLLNAAIPSSWPPETLADVQGLMAAKLSERPDEAGWWGWYIIAKSGQVAESATLIGSAGCSRWGPDRVPHFGYGLLPEYFRRGFATEAALALIDWVCRQPGVSQVHATTFERHHASRKILERCGFVNHGVSPDDATAAESDRQGRGQLLLFKRDVIQGPSAHHA